MNSHASAKGRSPKTLGLASSDDQAWKLYKLGTWLGSLSAVLSSGQVKQKSKTPANTTCGST